MLLESRILYEELKQQPLLRLAWNRQDPNYLSTFALDSHEVNSNTVLVYMLYTCV